MEPIFEIKVAFILVFSFCLAGSFLSLFAFFSKLEEERKKEKKKERESVFFAILSSLFFLIFVFFLVFFLIPEDIILREWFISSSTPQKTIFSAEVEKGKWLVRLEEPSGKSYFYFLSEKPPEYFQYKNKEFETDFFSSTQIPSASPSVSE
ncbi:MAG: hypothetical protein WC435_00580 [Candidatus Paceibacterota bacterium]